MNKLAILIYNPKSGRQQERELAIKNFIAMMEQKGFSVEARRTERAFHATELAKEVSQTQQSNRQTIVQPDRVEKNLRTEINRFRKSNSTLLALLGFDQSRYCKSMSRSEGVQSFLEPISEHHFRWIHHDCLLLHLHRTLSVRTQTLREEYIYSFSAIQLHSSRGARASMRCNCTTQPSY